MDFKSEEGEKNFSIVRVLQQPQKIFAGHPRLLYDGEKRPLRYILAVRDDNEPGFTHSILFHKSAVAAFAPVGGFGKAAFSKHADDFPG